MRIKSFRVPFSRVIPEDAHELEFGPDDYMVVRPLFGLPANEITDLSARIADVAEAPDTEAAAEAVIAEVLDKGIEEWHLSDESGAIPQPRGGDDLRKLPGALATSLYPFLVSYRGDAANPTTRS